MKQGCRQFLGYLPRALSGTFIAELSNGNGVSWWTFLSWFTRQQFSFGAWVYSCTEKAQFLRFKRKGRRKQGSVGYNARILGKEAKRERDREKKLGIQGECCKKREETRDLNLIMCEDWKYYSLGLESNQGSQHWKGRTPVDTMPPPLPFQMVSITR